MRLTKQSKRRRVIRSLRYPGYFHLSSAEGWLELGNQTEALGELDHISAAQRVHPDVLYVRWRIFASLNRWRRCLVIARALSERAKDDVRGWIALARSFRGEEELQKAYSVAITQASRFPESWQLLYDAASYACLLGKREQAVEYLGLAMAAGDLHFIRRKARKDPDFDRLWH